jgi:hypothetical protein
MPPKLVKSLDHKADNPHSAVKIESQAVKELQNIYEKIENKLSSFDPNEASADCQPEKEGAG